MNENKSSTEFFSSQYLHTDDSAECAERESGRLGVLGGCHVLVEDVDLSHTSPEQVERGQIAKTLDKVEPLRHLIVVV